MTRTLALLLAAAIAAAVPLVPAVAQADDAAEARNHFRKGEKLFALGKFAEALKHYEAAYDAHPMAEFLFNIGQCHRNLKHYDQAIFSFEKYLREKPTAANRKAVEKLIQDLEDEQARERERERERRRKQQEEDAARRVPLIPDPNPQPQPRDESKPFYATWWFWTGVVLVGAGAGAAVYFWPDGGGIPSSDLGNVDFPQ
jgi:tetratricopeptide (TPR) repeat protein